ncbi:immune-related, lectin-like receptor 4 isoform X2 [Salvelinus namaycush]|uniref:Immune-related, lectin-like receptor 4 isoform X2 n=1 Tax=Salvelinus namaycush TaxID=8040 RepID=A0A8U0PBT8_SALNM|nr:immune-related, lectin-like receptor 4 isoform X2 [Salvelinus namaycush]
MSEGIVYADVKFKKRQRTEGKDGAIASTANDATYSEISIPKAGRNQPSTDTNDISNLPTKNTELQILQAAYNQNLTSGNKDSPKPRNCAEDWEYYGGKCYYFSPDELTWAQSRDECITRGGHLVIIGSREEQNFLDQKIVTKMLKKAEDKFWIGLTDSTNENEWLWVDNSSLNSSTSFWFGKKEPDDWKGEKGEYPEGEDCARMGEPGGNTEWLDFNCNKTQRRICETKSPL